ncbi:MULTISPECIES: complex I NDUFA9 subunit family protein [unclassified Sphingomonas]|uniref:complex I NDUFA9 subunit family protein n=1 Tax=unclassified Sphingomonas TaxID=196159 RepID=UPI002269F894|nr:MULTISPECIES: complex I NDUFA9 subunit family protein [unclassified Sphingomonas]
MNDRLVTLIGGGGFLGRYVAQGLLAAGARVRIAQRDPRQAYFLRPQGGLGQTQFVAIDVNRPETVARAVEGSDSVVNLVGILGGNFDRIHVAGARHVAEAARAAGVESLIHVSAIGADARSPSAYGRSKGEGEAAVRAAFADATIMRPSVVFGPEDAFVNRFAGMIAKLPVVPVIRATAKFQPVFVGDVGVAIANAATAPQGTMGNTYELGGPDILAMGALVRWIAGALHRDVAIVDVPDLVGSAIARAGMLPGAPITWDQWLMLQHDNVVSDGMPGLAALGVVPTPLASVAPDWLVRFRRQGRFNRRVEDLAA